MTLSRIDGTGTPGLTVKLTGDISGSAEVQPDGQWSIPVTGPVSGQLSVHAVQTSDGGVDSPSVTTNLHRRPGRPGSIVDRGRLALQPGRPPRDDLRNRRRRCRRHSCDRRDSVGAAQAGAGGAGVGARAVVRSMVPHVLVAGGRWSVPFPADLTPGAHTLSVTQSVDGVASSPRLVTFTIDAAAVAPAAVPAEPAAPRPRCFRPAPASCRTPAPGRSCRQQDLPAGRSCWAVSCWAALSWLPHGAGRSANCRRYWKSASQRSGPNTSYWMSLAGTPPATSALRTDFRNGSGPQR